MKLVDALREYDKATREAAAINKKKKEADAAKAKAKAIVLAKLEEEELDGAPTKINGKTVNFSKYDLPFGRITDREAFAEWAAGEDGEAYFEPEARPRAELINALVRQRLDDGESLPPGVEVYFDTRLSRRAQ